MAVYSISDLAGSAGQSTFAFSIPYLDQAHIHVYIAGVETVLFTFASAFIISLNTPLAIAATVRIKRVTPIAEAIVTYNNGSTIGATNVNATALQALYAQQEIADTYYLATLGTINLVDTPLTSPIISGGISATGTLTGTLDVSTGRVIATGSSVQRTLADTHADQINVKGYPSTQAGYAEAVADAYAAGKELYWPAGTYVTTATVPNFHDVAHRGKGIVQRGSDLFYVDPSQNPGVTNTLYVSTTGNDTNDGLSSSQPRLTILSMGNVIYNYPYGNVTWIVKMAAGTFTAVNQTFSKSFPTPNRVQFNGPTVANGVQPTCIIQATGHGAGTAVVGLYFQNDIRAQVSHINFRNYRKDASVSANELGIGLIADSRCELYTVNVWTDDCDQGIYVTNGSHARIEAGRHGFNTVNGANVQFIRNSYGTVGYNGTAADVTGATGTAFIGGSYGTMLQEFSMAHTDYCYFSTQTLAGAFLTNSRIHSVSSTFLSCPIGIDARINSTIADTTNTFTTCTENMRLRSGSRHAGVSTINESLAVGPAIKEIDAVGASTQSNIAVNILSRAFAAKELEIRGAGFKWRGHFEVVGVAATKTVVVALGATTLLTATIAAATTDYEIQVDLIVHTAGSIQKLFTRVLQNGVLGVRVMNIAIAEDLTLARTLTVTHQVTNVADLNRFGWGELEIQH